MICIDGVNSMTGNRSRPRRVRRAGPRARRAPVRRRRPWLRRDRRALPGRAVRLRRSAATASSATLARATRTSSSSAASPRPTRRCSPSSPARPRSSRCSRPPRPRTSTRGRRRWPRSPPCSRGCGSTTRAAISSAPSSITSPARVLDRLGELGVHTPNQSGLPDHRGAARRPRQRRRGRQPAVRPGHLRDDGRLPRSSRARRSGSASS